jgi:hypothetical protein
MPREREQISVAGERFAASTPERRMGATDGDQPAVVGADRLVAGQAGSRKNRAIPQGMSVRFSGQPPPARATSFP